MALTAQQEAEYKAAWAAMTACDQVMEKFSAWVEVSHDASLDSINVLSISEGIVPLREAFRKRIKDIEQADELTRVKHELYEAQTRLAKLASEQEGGGDGR